MNRDKGAEVLKRLAERVRVKISGAAKRAGGRNKGRIKAGTGAQRARRSWEGGEFYSSCSGRHWRILNTAEIHQVYKTEDRLTGRSGP